MHLTEVAPVTQIRPLRPVAAAVQTSSAVKTAELQTQFVDRSCSCWADRLAEAMLMLIDVRTYSQFPRRRCMPEGPKHHNTRYMQPTSTTRYSVH